MLESKKPSPINHVLPLLHRSIKEGKDVIIKLDPEALSDGIDYRARDDNNSTALHLAVERGYLNWVEYLLANGSEVNVVNNFDLTPLMIAVYNEHSDILSILLQHGGNIHFINGKKQSVLHFAAATGNELCMQQILSHKPKVNIQDVEGATSLVVACKMRQSKMVQMLLQHRTVARANPNLQDLMMRTSLHWAVFSADVQSAGHLIEAGADLNIKDGENETAFVKAIRTNCISVFQLLIQAGCDRSDIDGLNGSALTLASALGKRDIVRLLLGLGEGVNDLGHMGCTPLSIATFEGQDDIVKELLDAGADPNHNDRNGMVPIIMAMIYIKQETVVQRHRCIAMLLRANANLCSRITMAGFFTKPTNGGNCTFSFAISSGYLSIMEMGLIAGAGIPLQKLRHYKKINDEKSALCKKWCDVSDFLELVHQWVASPLPLKFMCRKLIRRELGYGVQNKLLQLPLPTSVLHYLNLQELDHVQIRAAKTNCEDALTMKYGLPSYGSGSLQGTRIQNLYHSM